MPQLGLRVILFEMGKQLGIRKMPETRGIIGHGIGSAGNMVVAKAVAMMALVKTA